jgi:hypothetical protein
MHKWHLKMSSNSIRHVCPKSHHFSVFLVKILSMTNPYTWRHWGRGMGIRVVLWVSLLTLLHRKQASSPGCPDATIVSHHWQRHNKNIIINIIIMVPYYSHYVIVVDTQECESNTSCPASSTCTMHKNGSFECVCVNGTQMDQTGNCTGINTFQLNFMLQ